MPMVRIERGKPREDRYDYNDSGTYHRLGCRYCDGADYRTLAELRAASARPCGVCTPPDCGSGA